MLKEKCNVERMLSIHPIDGSVMISLKELPSLLIVIIRIITLSTVDHMLANQNQKKLSNNLDNQTLRKVF